MRYPRRFPRTPARIGLEALEARDNPAVNFASFGAAAGGLPLVEVLRPDGSSLARFEAFESGFRGGVRAASAELDNNPNTLEVVAGAGPTGGAAARVFSVDLATARVTTLAAFFAFDPAFTGGVRVAAGDVNGDGVQEVIAGADSGGGPRVRALTLAGGSVANAAGTFGDFFAFEPSFTGGVRVAAGEVDGNLANGDELVLAAGTGGGPRVRVMRSDGSVVSDGFAVQPDFLGGVNVGVESTGSVGRVRVDTLADDPSQRNAALNAAALGGFPTTGAGIGTGATGTPTAARADDDAVFAGPTVLGANPFGTNFGTSAVTSGFDPFGTGTAAGIGTGFTPAGSGTATLPVGATTTPVGTATLAPSFGTNFTGNGVLFNPRLTGLTAEQVNQLLGPGAGAFTDPTDDRATIPGPDADNTL